MRNSQLFINSALHLTLYDSQLSFVRFRSIIPLIVHNLLHIRLFPTLQFILQLTTFLCALSVAEIPPPVSRLGSWCLRPRVPKQFQRGPNGKALNLRIVLSICISNKMLSKGYLLCLISFVCCVCMCFQLNSDPNNIGFD